MTSNFLFAPVSNEPLVLFRWLFGAVLAVTSIERSRRNIRVLTCGKIHIGYELTRFLRPLPPKAMRLVLCMDIPLSVAFMIGVIWPWPALLLCLLSSYVLLLDASKYLNHIYLVCLLLGIYSILDAGYLRLVPRWQLLLVQFQFLIVYFYAGVGKLNADWLWRNEPLRSHLLALKTVRGPPWLRRRIVPSAEMGRLIELVAKQRVTAGILCWAAAIFDLGIGFALTNRIVMPAATILFVGFHAFNHWFYGLGIFPYINYASLALFIPSEAFRSPQVLEVRETNTVEPVLFIACWLTLQVLVPLRRYLHAYSPPSGAISIHSDHHRHFSWTMKLRDATVKGFSVELFDRRTGSRLRSLALSSYLTPGAIYQCARSPRAIVMALERIEPLLAREVDSDVGIRVRGRISYNGRPFVTPINPKTDLRGEKVRIFGDYPWHFQGD